MGWPIALAARVAQARAPCFTVADVIKLPPDS
jgi:hypothetical protein